MRNKMSDFENIEDVFKIFKCDSKLLCLIDKHYVVENSWNNLNKILLENEKNPSIPISMVRHIACMFQLVELDYVSGIEYNYRKKNIFKKCF